MKVIINAAHNGIPRKREYRYRRLGFGKYRTGDNAWYKAIAGHQNAINKLRRSPTLGSTSAHSVRNASVALASYMPLTHR